MIEVARSSTSSFPVSSLILPSSRETSNCNVIVYFSWRILLLDYFCSVITQLELGKKNKR